jgi:hypothetical protein
MGLGTLPLTLGAAKFAQHSGGGDLATGICHPSPRHFRLRQSDNTRWQPTTPPRGRTQSSAEIAS